MKNWRREVKEFVVEFEEENEFSMKAAGGKGGEIELGLKRRDVRRTEFTRKFNGKMLNRFKRVRKGSGGRIPDNGTILKVGSANEGYIEPDKGRKGGMRIEVTKYEAENFTGFATNSRNMRRPEKGGCKQDAKIVEGGYTFNRRLGNRKRGERIKVGGRFAGGKCT